MNKKFSHILAAALAVIICMCTAITAFAETGTSYSTEIGGTKTTTFDKYLVMDAKAEVPNVTFSYTIAPGQAIASADGKFAVLAGIPTPTLSDGGVVTFASTDTTLTTAAEGDYLKKLDSGEKYAKHTVEIDFTNVVFPEPGVYRYVITEDSTAKQGIVYDTANTRILDVYVEDASTSEAKLLTIAGYVLHANATELTADAEKFGTAENTAAANTAESDYKSQGFTNEYVTHNLTFSKAVSGNQASRDKYFAFTVAITDALPNTKYNVNITDADAVSGTNSATAAENAGKANATEITTDASGAVTATFYLQHGQSITIEGLTDKTKWTVIENAEDYKADVTVTGDDATGNGNTASDATGIEADETAAFTNSREGAIPTGVILTVAPFAAMMLVGIIGALIVLTRKKRGITG